MSMDITEVSSLLHIIRESAAHGNMFANIRQVAMQKLHAIDTKHGKVIAAQKADHEQIEAARPKIVAAEPVPTAPIERRTVTEEVS